MRRLAIPVAILIALVSAAGAAARPVFVLKGHGWGHGVGMSQYGALGYAQDGWTYDQILGHFYTGAELGPAPVAGVRVLVAEAKGSVTVRSSVP